MAINMTTNNNITTTEKPTKNIYYHKRTKQCPLFKFLCKAIFKSRTKLISLGERGFPLSPVNRLTPLRDIISVPFISPPIRIKLLSVQSHVSAHRPCFASLCDRYKSGRGSRNEYRWLAAPDERQLADRFQDAGIVPPRKLVDYLDCPTETAISRRSFHHLVFTEEPVSLSTSRTIQNVTLPNPRARSPNSWCRIQSFGCFDVRRTS